MSSACLDHPVATTHRHRSRPPAGTRNVSVLHVINGEHYSGAERVQDLLSRQLPAMGYDVAFACLKPDKFPAMRENRAAVIHAIPMRGRLDLRPVAGLVRTIRRHGYELVHAHTPRALFVAGLAALIAGVPLVYHVHSPTSRDSTRRWQNRINARIERLGLRFASAVIAVSNSLARHVRGLTGRPASVVHNGVPARRPRPIREPGTREWTLGTMALFRPRKGMEVLLEALAQLRAQGLPVRLRAVGGFETPDYERQLKSLCGRLGLDDVVDWVGFVRHVDSELARMDLFVLPSLFGEGLPMVILEAMAAGVPVVATRVEGAPEAIREGRDGELAEPDNARSLAGAIARVVRGESDWASLRASALARHAEGFSDRKMAEGVAEVYDRVLSRAVVHGSVRSKAGAPAG